MRRFPHPELKEFKVFKKLNTPRKVQDFIDNIPINFEKGGETCRSPLLVLKNSKAHCMEGAMLAAAAFWYNGQKPLLLDLRTIAKDQDHVVTLFKEGGLWGVVSKTNHAVLRFRDPVYKTVRELAMSYFNEYFLDNGVKTMRSYSTPFSLLGYGDEWLTANRNVWEIPGDLDDSLHFNILDKRSIKKLRLADKVEIEAGKLTQWKK